MNKERKLDILKICLPHIVAILVFIVLNSIYFSPQLRGEKLHQHDKLQSIGMSRETDEFRSKTGTEALWTNAAFAGMPAYQISVAYTNPLKKINNFILKLIPRPIGYFLLLMLGFYIMLLCLGVNPWLAIVGGIAFGLSSLNMIYIAGGHNTKIHAISFIPPIIGGLFYAYRKHMIKGSFIVAVFLSLHISANHIQMTYYAVFLIAAIVIMEFYLFLKRKEILKFTKISASLFVAVAIALAINITNLLTTFEYSKYSTRSKSELTIKNEDIKTKALDLDYIKHYSLGFGEVWSIVIPNVKGGKMELIGNNKEMLNKINPNYRKVMAGQLTYWGEQNATGGAIYFGASIFILFILGLFFVKEKQKWVLLAISLLAIILSWKYGSLVDWFINNFPMFNKFRDTKMMLILVQVALPLLAILFLKTILTETIDKKKYLYVVGSVLGVFLIIYLSPDTWFSFFSNNEVTYFNKLAVSYRTNPNALNQINDIKSQLNDIRIDVFKKDVIRAVFFMFAVGLAVYLFMIKKIKTNTLILVVACLVVIDMWTIDKRYLNEDNFESVRKERTFYKKTKADQAILKDKDPNFKVMNLTVSTFNDASTSLFHKSIGGYHGAKMLRYQELIEHHISKNNMNVLNMLNTKYFIVPNQKRQPVAQLNREALGNAWFVQDYRIVKNADEEISALSDFNPKREAIIDQRFAQFVEGKNFVNDTSAFIKLTSYKPNHLKYQTNSQQDQLAVFSEIYYPKGWNAFIDGQSVSHFRTNYVLRAMVIPAGKHNIEFKFQPKSYSLGNKISLAGSSILIILLILLFGRELLALYKNKQKD
ncbi:MAG: YfhO family protein [Bacteroidales bacterium]|nr:YfhO family protein [Bacteroidales bacterium]